MSEAPVIPQPALLEDVCESCRMRPPVAWAVLGPGVLFAVCRGCAPGPADVPAGGGPGE